MRQELSTEIELIKQSALYTNLKVDEIHKVLIGNGKKGLIEEMSEIRGVLKFTQISFGFLLTVITIVLAVIK